MSADIRLNLVGALPLKRQLELLQMGTQKRRRLLYRVAQRVIKDSKKRVRQQIDLQGRPFKERWKKRSDRRKMLSKLITQMNVVENDSTRAIIGFYKTGSGRIAAKQQYGDTQRLTAAQNRADAREKGKQFYDKPATKKQAMALRDAGFKVKAGTKKARRAPINWIVNNLTIGQAGYALARLRAWSGEASKTSWMTVLPARSFLGATPAEVTAYIEQIYEDMTKELQRGVR
jgi:phage gpG-like protein